MVLSRVDEVIIDYYHENTALEFVADGRPLRYDTLK